MICEVGTGSTLVNFISMPGIGTMSHERAAAYLTLYWGGAMVGRFLGSWIPRRVAPQRVLAAVTIGALVLVGIAISSSGYLAMSSLIAAGPYNSIMWPTIFTLGIRGLGPLTEQGSGPLIMAVAELQGVLADHIGLQLS